MARRLFSPGSGAFFAVSASWRSRARYSGTKGSSGSSCAFPPLGSRCLVRPTPDVPEHDSGHCAADVRSVLQSGRRVTTPTTADFRHKETQARRRAPSKPTRKSAHVRRHLIVVPAVISHWVR